MVMTAAAGKEKSGIKTKLRDKLTKKAIKEKANNFFCFPKAIIKNPVK